MQVVDAYSLRRCSKLQLFFLILIYPKQARPIKARIPLKYLAGISTNDDEVFLSGGTGMRLYFCANRGDLKRGSTVPKGQYKSIYIQSEEKRRGYWLAAFDACIAMGNVIPGYIVNSRALNARCAEALIEEQHVPKKTTS